MPEKFVNLQVIGCSDVNKKSYEEITGTISAKKYGDILFF